MKINPTDCLNCGQPLQSNYCEHCGQKASTKRFTMKQLVSNDFITGFFDLEKGFFYTLKALFTRPGYFIRAYINGKRRTYFHFLTFLLLILAISIFVGEFSKIKLTDLIKVKNDTANVISSLEYYSKEYPRIALLAQIPIISFMSFLFFRKAKQNYAEHIILNSFKISGELVIGILFTLLTIFYTNVKVLTLLYSTFITLVLISFGIIVYYQYFKSFYKKKTLLFFRALLCVFCSQILVMLLFGFIIGLKAGMEGKF